MSPALVILIAEDEPILRYGVADALRSEGWRVLEASRGEDALAYLDAGESIDIVFTDISLGGSLDGWDVADAYRSARGDIPVMYASGNVHDRSRQVEDSQFFQKPYRASAIVTACRKMAECRRQDTAGTPK